MTSTLLIRLQAPMQAWGVQSLFDSRDTCREPTRSGVVGLLCCALGRHRDEPLDDLNRLKMGIRVDQEGRMMKDFQTARNIMNAIGKPGANITSDRFYLADAVFLVGLESEDVNFLTVLLKALQHPRWLLYLGRRAFPPSKPVWLPNGLRLNEGLESALQNYPFLLGKEIYQKADQLRLLMDDSSGSINRQDFPMSFKERSFHLHSKKIQYFSKPSTFLKEVADVS